MVFSILIAMFSAHAEYGGVFVENYSAKYPKSKVTGSVSRPSFSRPQYKPTIKRTTRLYGPHMSDFTGETQYTADNTPQIQSGELRAEDLMPRIPITRKIEPEVVPEVTLPVVPEKINPYMPEVVPPVIPEVISDNRGIQLPEIAPIPEVKPEDEVVLPEVAPIPLPDPRDRDDSGGETTITEQPQEDRTSPGTPTINDISSCGYHNLGASGHCWKNKPLKDQIAKIVDNVAYINSLHGWKIDKKFMVCMAWRESAWDDAIDPGVKVDSTVARGMYQVTRTTANGAVRVGSKLPGFEGLSGSQYQTKMVTSTLAQTELSMMTIKLKINEGASSRIINGGATTEDYTELAWRYVGKVNTSYATGYKRKITDCYSCFKSSGVLENASKYGSDETKRCLRKAKD